MSTQTGIVEVTCVSCGAQHAILVPTSGYHRWTSGQAKIQDALPMLSADERELLMSHICPRCFDKIFGEEG